MARGLSAEDVAGLAEQLAAGRRPRVQLSGPHFPPGATGTVVRVGEPESDGPDYLRVRVKVDNLTDELAFNPGELKLPGRGRPARRSAAKSPAKPAAPVAKAAAPVAKAAAPVHTAPAAASPARKPAGAAAPSGRRRKPASVQRVTFTVSSAGANWSLSATRGSRSLIKQAPLAPGVVSALAELIDQPGLSSAVSDINDVALTEARARAEELRAELNRLEAVLATHDRP